MLGSYGKSVTAVLGAVAMAVAASLTDNVITNPEKVQIATAGVAAFSVFITANVGLPLWKYSKAIAAGSLAGLTLLGGYLANGDHLTNALWLNVAIAAFTAAGVFAVPNEPTSNVIDVRG